MTYRGKSYLNEDRRLKVVEYFVFSWTLDEYLEATQDNELFASVQSTRVPLPMSATELNQLQQLTREALVQSKYYFAGGSARFVFDYGVADAVALFTQAVDAVPSAAVNRLFSKFTGQERAGLVVQYATSAMAIYGRSSVIKYLADVIKEDFNLATDGWMLEVFVFASLRKGGVTFLAEDGSEIQWACAKIKVTSPSNLLLLLDTEGTWIKPPVFNQGGYDVVYLDKTQGLVHFVQMRTRAHSRSAFHIGYFYKSLKDLQQPSQSFEVTTREIFFVVDMKKASRTRRCLAKDYLRRFPSGQ